MVEPISPSRWIWSGVYSSFQEAGFKETGHLNSVWISKSITRLREESNMLTLGPPTTLGMMLSGISLPEVRILDVGGNLGWHYISLSRQVTGVDFKFTVFELPSFLRHPEIHRNLLPKVEYSEKISDLHRRAYDVVYFGSVIQYFSDWKEKLSEVITAAGTPSFLVFDDLMIGPQQSFVSIQKYYDDAMTMWFLNEDEFYSEVQSLGYKMKFRCEFKTEGKHYFPPPSLPADKRIPFAQTAIFECRSS